MLCFPLASQFWREVLMDWTKFKLQFISSEIQVKDQILWFNSEIRIANKPFIWYKWLKAGIIRMNHLVNDDNVFYTLEHLIEKYNISTSFLEYCTLILAIPKDWKEILVKNNINCEENENCYLVYKKYPSIMKPIYFNLNHDPLLFAEIMFKWAKKQDEDFMIDMEGIQKAISNINKISILSKLRSFQYKLLCKALTTNIHLQKYKIKSTNLCSFCDIEKETILHLFWMCQCVHRLWNEVFRLLSIEISNITAVNIIYNDIMPNPRFIQNCIVLITKHFIYVSRCLERPLTLPHLKNQIWSIHDIELYNAKKNNKIGFHESKWVDAQYLLKEN